MRGLATPRGRRPSRPIRCASRPFGIALGHMRRPRGPVRHPSAPTSLVPGRRAPWPRRAVLLVLVAAGWVAAGTLRAQAPYGDDHARGAALDPANLVIPDDVVLFEQLERAVDLRRREDFDRMLDARDPGELVEHATLSEAGPRSQGAWRRRALHRRRRALRLPVPPRERLGRRRSRPYGDRLHAAPASRPPGRGRRPRRVRVLRLPLEGRARRRRHADAERVHARRRRADQRRRSAQPAARPRSRPDRVSGARDERRAARPGGRGPRAREGRGTPHRSDRSSRRASRSAASPPPRTARSTTRGSRASTPT